MMAVDEAALRGGGAVARQLRRQQQAVAELGLLALRERSLQALLDEAARLVKEAVGTDFSKILETSAGGDLVVKAGVGWPPGVVGVLEVPVESDSQASYAFRTRQPVVVSDLTSESRFEPDRIFLELGVRSGVNVVIEGAQTPFGILEVDCREVRSYTQDEIDFLQAAANVLSQAIQRQQADLDREHLLNTASHELRNPLTVVLAFSRRLHRQLSQGAAIEPESTGDVQTLLDAAVRLEQLVSMLFQLGEAERETLDFTPEPVSLTALLRDIVQQARELHPGVTIEEDYQDSPVVMAHEGWARVVLANLVDNAAKYSTLEPHVTVRADSAQGQARIYVRDGCGGLNGEELDNLFERYFRGRMSEGVRGLGLGLYLVRRFSTVLGWRIDVESYPGSGCEFQVIAGSVLSLEGAHGRATEPLISSSAEQEDAMVSGESTYGETHLGNADVLNSGGQVVAVGRLAAMKYLDDDGIPRWQGHFTAVAPPNAVDDLDGEFTLRLADGTLHPVMIDQELQSQLAPGVQLAITGLGEPPY